jgi:hypothetical protein
LTSKMRNTEGGDNNIDNFSIADNSLIMQLDIPLTENIDSNCNTDNTDSTFPSQLIIRINLSHRSVTGVDVAIVVAQ